MSRKPQRSGAQAKGSGKNATKAAARDLQPKDDRKVAGGTKVKAQDLSFVHILDKSSPVLS